MKNKTIFDLLQMYINKEPMPKRIKYGLMQDGYKYFRWEDYDCFEYVNEGDETCRLSNMPWHHYMDEVEIVKEPQTDKEIARAIVHKAIDDAVIAEDAYPDLRQKMHYAVDNYEPQTESTGSPIGDYRDGVGIWSSDCALKKGE